MTDIVVVGAGFFPEYGAVPAGLLGERGDRQPRRQLHDSRTGEECAPSSSTTLVKGLARTAHGLAELVPGAGRGNCGQQGTVTDRFRGEDAEQIEIRGLLVWERAGLVPGAVHRHEDLEPV